MFFVWVWNQSEGSVNVFTLEPWKVKVLQLHKGFDSEKERNRSLEEKLRRCLPSDSQTVGATGWRRRTRTSRLCGNSVKWSLIKVANRFANSLLIRPGSWWRLNKKKNDNGFKRKKNTTTVVKKRRKITSDFRLSSSRQLTSVRNQCKSSWKQRKAARRAGNSEAAIQHMLWFISVVTLALCVENKTMMSIIRPAGMKTAGATTMQLRNTLTSTSTSTSIVFVKINTSHFLFCTAAVQLGRT